MTKDEALRLALEALENNRRTHHYCEDTWYSCPKHEDGCANDSEGDECNCGADKANAGIDEAITAIKATLDAKDEPVAVWELFEDGWDSIADPEWMESLPVGTRLYTTKDKPVKVIHQHQWFRTGEMKVGQMRCISCGAWAKEEMPQQEVKDKPVAVVSGYYGGQCVVLPTNPARLFNSGTAFYTTPPQRKPLTLEQLSEHWKVAKVFDMTYEEIYIADYVLIARDVEALHGIKEKSND